MTAPSSKRPTRLAGERKPEAGLGERVDPGRRKRPQAGLLGAVRDLAGAFVPMRVQRLQREIDARVRELPVSLNEYGYDAYGFHPDVIARTSLFSAFFYRHYFRVRTVGIEHVPSGRALLICNHAGQLPFDGMMLSMALLLEPDPPRLARPMAEYWVSQLPWVSVLAARSGAMVGTRENCVTMLEAGECVMAFPEGVGGMNKLYSERYKLQRFGQGFLRLALETETPIVPVALIGSEEQQPGLANLKTLARALGMPALPITPTFPWLGPLGLMPLPVRYHFYFGEPLHFEGDPGDEDAVIEKKVGVVRRAIEKLFERGLGERQGVFR